MADKNIPDEETQERLKLIRSFIHDNRQCDDLNDKIKKHDEEQKKIGIEIQAYTQNDVAMKALMEAGQRYDELSEYREKAVQVLYRTANALDKTLAHEQQKIEKGLFNDLAYFNEQEGVPKVKLPKTYEPKKD